jgi:hypothetical protein
MASQQRGGTGEQSQPAQQDIESQQRQRVEKEEDREEEEEAGLYWPSQRHEWADVAPLWPDDGCAKVVSITYSDRDAELLAYLRAVVAAGDMSHRALRLTAEVSAPRTALAMAAAGDASRGPLHVS